MTGDPEQRERPRQRFAALQPAPEPAAPAAPPPASEPPAPPAAGPRTSMRRRDYKGERRRLNLRVSADIVDELDVFCLAAGLDKNSFCESLIRRALADKLPEVRRQFGDDQWAALQKAARGK